MIAGYIETKSSSPASYCDNAVSALGTIRKLTPSIFGAPFAAPYAASKGGIVQMTKALATAWAVDWPLVAGATVLATILSVLSSVGSAAATAAARRSVGRKAMGVRRFYPGRGRAQPNSSRVYFGVASRKPWERIHSPAVRVQPSTGWFVARVPNPWPPFA